MIREKLLDANKFCIIYKDKDGINCYHNTQKNETYRIIPHAPMLGFYIEKYKEEKLVSRNHISFDEMEVLTDITGQNHLLTNLKFASGESKGE